jgi:protein KRI1
VIALQDLDLEGDWDPNAHDQQMAGLYGDDSNGDDEKPQWDDDIDIADINPEKESISKKKKKKKKAKEADDADEGVDVDAMDADVERMDDDEEWDGTEEMRKRKLNEYMDEIYGLDFNDMVSRQARNPASNALADMTPLTQVGDMPTRFKYTPVQSQSFSLTPAEILMATDAELNQYLSVKKYAPYRKDNRWDQTRGDRLKELKQSVAERSHGAFGMDAGSSRDGEKPKKRMGKKERMKLKATGVEQFVTTAKSVVTPPGSPNVKRKHEEIADVDEEQEGSGSGKRKRRRQKKTHE